MAGLSHLRDVYEKRGKDFLENLLNKKVIVNEKSEGAYFGVKRDAKSGKLNYFKKDSKLGYVDRVLSKYYESGISKFEKLNPALIARLPENLVFGMDYDPKKKDSLTLTHIKILDEQLQTKSIIHDKANLEKWALHLGVNPPSIIFEGLLNDDQKVKIQEFIFTPLTELQERFKTQSFTKHIISVLNPSLDEAAQSKLEERGIDEIVFRFYDNQSTNIDEAFELAKIIDPVFHDRAKSIPLSTVQKKSDDYIWIIVIDLMNFIESYRLSDLRKYVIDGETVDERYISLINQIFRDFIQEYGEKYSNLDINTPEFLKLPEFDVNTDLIGDGRVAEIIASNQNYKEIYRILVNIFRKKKLKISSRLFTDQMKKNLESQIQKLNKISLSDSLYENYFPSFTEFVGEGDDPGYFETFDRQIDEKPKVQRVNLIVSEFQPLHNGHIKSAKLLKEKNGLHTLFVSVHPGKTSKAFPLKSETVVNMMNRAADGNKEFLAGHRMTNSSNIESLLKVIKPDFEPVLIASDGNRLRDLALQLELAKKRSRNLNIKRDTKLIELPSDLSQSGLLNSIKNNDFGEFKKGTPQSIHSEFYAMNKDLTDSLNESVVHTLAIEDDVSNDPIIEIE